MGGTIYLQNKASIYGFVQTALYSAGEYLKSYDEKYAKNPAVFEADLKAGRISETYRPALSLLTINDKGGWFSSRNISLFSNNFNTTTPAETTTTSKEEEEKKKQEREAFWNSVIGSLIALAGAALTGFTYGNYQTYKETLAATNANAYIIKDLPEHFPIRNSLTNLVQNQQAIDTLNYTRTRNYFYASLGCLAGGGAWALGGFLYRPGLSTLGKILSLISGGYALFNFFSRHWTDAKKIRECSIYIAGNGQNSMGWANHILYHDFPNYDETMQLLWQCGLNYQVPPSYNFNVHRGYLPLYPRTFAPSAPPM